MMEPLIRLDPDAFKALLKSKQLLRKNVVEAADIVESTLSYAFRRGCTRDTIDKIEKALGATAEECKLLEIPADGSRNRAAKPLKYEWKDVEDLAVLVKQKIFGEKPPAALLTFPGPATVFTGLVLQQLVPRKAFLKVPVYTAVLLGKDAPDLPAFKMIPTDRFKIFIPLSLFKEVLDQQKKVVVVDDTIITGVTMEKMRRFFNNRYDVEFACAVCYEGRTLPSEVPPEIIGTVAPTPELEMPWGDGFCNEDCFPLVDDTRAKHATA